LAWLKPLKENIVLNERPKDQESPFLVIEVTTAFIKQETLLLTFSNKIKL
jgi:hypothetical protein